MPYNPNIPQPNDILSVSQGDILANFQELNNFINVSFFPINTAQEGINKWVIFDTENLPALPALTATQIGFVAQTATLGDQLGSPSIFLLSDLGATIDIFARQAAATGWSVLPSGILIKWGTLITDGAGHFTYVFPVGADIPPFRGLYVITTSITTPGAFDINAAVYIDTNTLTILQFDIYSWERGAINNPIPNIPVKFIAIGLF